MRRVELKEISEYQKKQCELFSEYCIGGNFDKYKTRGQADIDKIIKDIYDGKRAEFMVYNYLIDRNKDCSMVDLNIYDIKKKSFSADLKSGENFIHIKNHFVNKFYPVSWLFQKEDRFVTSPTDFDYGFFCVSSEKENYGYIVKASKLVYSDPWKEEIKKTKKCILETSLNITLNNEKTSKIALF